MASSSQLQPDAIPEYNILLLGESGAGKSLFINSLINYIQHETLAEAQNGLVSVVIPIKFKITDDNDKEHVISEGTDDDNECLKRLAHSSTAKCRSYLVNFGQFKVRLIDTPGVGSTVTKTEENKGKFDKHKEGVEKDKKYVESVLKFISHFEDLHAIVIVVKSNETRYTTRFELCLKLLLTSFNKSSINNIFFVLTFGESSRFKADIAKEPLKMLLENVTSSKPDDLLSKNKLYIVDNKGFRYLLAVKQGAYFEELEKTVSEKAWTVSVNECNRLIDYITGHLNLLPHQITDTLSIKEARTFINIVEHLIEDILKVIYHNKEILDECLASSSDEDEQIAEFENRLNEKQDVEIVQAELPLTVCKLSKCAITYKMDGDRKTYNSNICCQGCRAPFMMRLFCTAFNLISGTCKVCGCHVRYHQRIYFTTKIVAKAKERKEKDAIIKEMASATDNKQKIEIAKRYVDIQQKKIDNEKMVIETAQLTFKNFLKTNPIISMEAGDNFDAEVNILPREVFVTRDQLLNLEVFGPKIKEAYDIAKQGEEADWMANKLDLTKEKTINAFNSKWCRTDNKETKVSHITTMAPTTLKDDNF